WSTFSDADPDPFFRIAPYNLSPIGLPGRSRDGGTGMGAKPHYLEHRKRLRDRFQKTGIDGLHDYELIELLLTYAMPRVDVKPIAKELIKRFGGLAGTMDATRGELEAVAGMGPVSATL